MIFGKVWGNTSVLLRTAMVEVHRLEVLPNTHCSMHKHERKWNGFVCISGLLLIDVEKSDYPLTDTTMLRPGEFTTVKPGEFHRFRTGGAPTVALELYYPESLSEDIIRKDCGGLVETPAPPEHVQGF